MILIINNNKSKLNFINELSSLINIKEEKNNIYFNKNLNWTNFNYSLLQNINESSSISINNNNTIYFSNLEKTINDLIT